VRTTRTTILSPPVAALPHAVHAMLLIVRCVKLGGLTVTDFAK
jgi:hypothetical protein